MLSNGGEGTALLVQSKVLQPNKHTCMVTCYGQMSRQCVVIIITRMLSSGGDGTPTVILYQQNVVCTFILLIMIHLLVFSAIIRWFNFSDGNPVVHRSIV